MNSKQLNKVLLAISLLLFAYFAACSSKTESSSSTTEETPTEETSAAPAEEERPSPLIKLNDNIGNLAISLQYGSPGVKGREIWGGLEPYDAVWRTGANEATWVEFSEDITVNGESLPAGKYGLFTIPKEEGAWTVIFNKVWDQWGAYDYDESEDALRVDIDPVALEKVVERLAFEIQAHGDDAGSIVFTWEKVKLEIPVAVSAAS